MPRRSRHRNRGSGLRAGTLIAVLLLLVAGAWFWQRDARETASETAAASTPSADADRREATLALPPADSVPLGEATVAAPAPPPPSSTAPRPATALPGFLPAEARETLRLIASDGPFPHRQDGTVFGNREGRLQKRERGFYREYTVETPGLGHRGARRIVTGGRPPSEYYYTDDHYESFRRFDVPAQVRP